MTTTVTLGATNIPIDMLLGYQTTRETGNILHPVLSRNDVEVTLKEAGLRSGTLKFLCLDVTKALQLEALHASVGVFALTVDDLSGISMRYVPSRGISMELDPETRLRWIVSVDFQEVR